jgi:hypothetical protein
MSKAIKLATVLITILSVASCGAPGRASDFSATTLEGDEFRLSEKQGEVVALYFMAGW